MIPPGLGLGSIVLGAAHAAGQAGSPIQWGDVPTWATALVAAVALGAAWLAYDKQADAADKLAQQVGLQRDQLKDQKEASANLAQQVGLQRDQLKLQREALVNQQEANRQQAEVVKEQLREMAERAEAYERQQADAITMTATHFAGELDGVRDKYAPFLHMAVVGNEWHRPIRNVICRIQRTGNAGTEPAIRSGKLIKVQPSMEQQATFGPVYGPLQAHDELVDITEDGKVPFVRAGERAAFIFKRDLEKYPHARITARFTDDAGLHWQIDPDLSLTRLGSRDDW